MKPNVRRAHFDQSFDMRRFHSDWEDALPKDCARRRAALQAARRPTPRARIPLPDPANRTVSGPSCSNFCTKRSKSLTGIDLVLLANSRDLRGRNVRPHFHEEQLAVAQHEFIGRQVVIDVAERDEHDLVAKMRQRLERIHRVHFDKTRQMAVRSRLSITRWRVTTE